MFADSEAGRPSPDAHDSQSNAGPEVTEVQKDVTVVFHHRLRTRLWCSRLHKALPDGRAWRYLWPCAICAALAALDQGGTANG